jgi:hypothetical protein
MEVCRLSFTGDEIRRLVDCASAKNSAVVAEVFELFAIYAAGNYRQLLELNLLERIHGVPMLVYPRVRMGFMKLVSVIGEAGAEEVQECLRVVNLGDWFWGSYWQQQYVLKIVTCARKFGIVPSVSEGWPCAKEFVAGFIEGDDAHLIITALTLLIDEELDNLDSTILDRIADLTISSNQDVSELARQLSQRLQPDSK